MSKWYPEIMYEESETGESSKIPFVMVPPDEVMPAVLFMFESRETGEFEPNHEGVPVPIIEWDLYQYANMNELKKKLSLEHYNIVRSALGLEPLEQAAESGSKITEKIKSNFDS